MAEPDLFAGITAATPAPEPPRSGLLVTNDLNLMYMLAAGLVMPPAGFGEKYYRDTLECFSGWIPLFVDKAPAQAIESSTREAGHLKPVIIEIRLSGLSGRVTAMGQGGLRELQFPNEIDGTEWVLLVPAPLPTAWIESILFRSPDDRRACERNVKDLANVPLEDFKRTTRKALFTKTSDTYWPPGKGPAERAVALEFSLAAGGVMAMLFLFGNLGDQAALGCRRAFDPVGGSLPSVDESSILDGIKPWMHDGSEPLPASARAETNRSSLQSAYQTELFWGAVVRLAKWREAGRVGSPENVLIDYLDGTLADLDPRVRAGVSKLRDTLESMTGLVDATVSIRSTGGEENREARTGGGGSQV